MKKKPVNYLGIAAIMAVCLCLGASALYPNHATPLGGVDRRGLEVELSPYEKEFLTPVASAGENITDLHLGDDAAIDAYFAAQQGEGRDGLSWASCYQVKDLQFNISSWSIPAIYINGNRYIEISNCSFFSEFSTGFDSAINVMGIALKMNNCSISGFSSVLDTTILEELILSNLNMPDIAWGVGGSILGNLTISNCNFTFLSFYGLNAKIISNEIDSFSFTSINNGKIEIYNNIFSGSTSSIRINNVDTALIFQNDVKKQIDIDNASTVRIFFNNISSSSNAPILLRNCSDSKIVNNHLRGSDHYCRILDSKAVLSRNAIYFPYGLLEDNVTLYENDWGNWWQFYLIQNPTPTIINHYYNPAFGADLYPLVNIPSLIVNSTVGEPSQENFDFRNPSTISVPIFCEIAICAYYEVYQEEVFLFAENWTEGSININCASLGLGQHNFTIKFYNFPLFGSFSPDKTITITGIGYPPASPIIITENIATSSHSIIVEWTSVDWATSYKIYVNEDFYQEVEDNSIILALSEENEYRISVTAINEFGESIPSDFIIIAITSDSLEPSNDKETPQNTTNNIYFIATGATILGVTIGVFASRLKKPKKIIQDR